VEDEAVDRVQSLANELRIVFLS